MIVVEVEDHGLHHVGELSELVPQGTVDEDGRVLRIPLLEELHPACPGGEGAASAAVGYEIAEDGRVILEPEVFNLLQQVSEISISCPNTHVEAVPAADIEYIGGGLYAVDALLDKELGHGLSMLLGRRPVDGCDEHDLRRAVADLDGSFFRRLFFFFLRPDDPAGGEQEEKNGA